MVTTTIDTIGSFRRNLLFETGDLSSGSSWASSNVTVTLNTATAPDGTATAATLSDSSSGSSGHVLQVVPDALLTDTEVYTASLHIKTLDANQSGLRIENAGGTTFLDLRVDWDSDGTPSVSATTSEGGAGVHTYYVRPSRNGFWRLEVSITYDASEGGGNEDMRWRVWPDTEASSQKSIYAWGPQFEERSHASAYQAQLTTTDVWTGDYATITAWESDRSDPIGDDKVYVGALIDGEHVYDADAIEISSAAGNTDATRYRKLTYSQTRYVPHEHDGPKVYIQWVDNSSAQEGIRVTEDYFQMDGIAVICEDPRQVGGASSVNRVALQVEGSQFLGQSLFVKNSETVNADPSPSDFFCLCVQVIGTSGFEAVNCRFFNCLFEGGANGHGATLGVYYAPCAEDGGLYNCGVRSITRGVSRGFLSNVASVGVAPELVNCWAFDCHSNGGKSIQGLWSRYGYNISSDEFAEAGVPGGTRYTKDPVTGAEGTAVGGADEWSHIYQDDAAQLFRSGAQDYRPKAQSAAYGAGRDESATFTAAGISVVDYEGTSRSNSTAWSIGPFDSPGTSPGRATERVELIGSATTGRHYKTVQDWADATGGTSLRNQVEIRVGEIQRDDASAFDLGAGVLQMSRAVTDAGFYRHLRGSDSWRYNPTEQAGATIQGEGTADLSCVLFVGERYFRATGLALQQDYTGAGSRRLARIDADDVRLDALSLRFTGSTGSLSRSLQVRGSRFLGTNLLAIGSGTSAGTTTAFHFSECDQAKLYHCVAVGITAGATGRGFQNSTRATRSEFSGCIGALCDIDYTVGTGVVDFSISTDATLAGLPGCQSSVTFSTIWNAIGSEDFRLTATSPALNAGRNLGARFATDFMGNRRLAPFDLGIFEGIGSSVPTGQAPVLRADSQFRAKLIEIIRPDGVGFWFTDANHPLTHAGRLYVPQDGVDASARREESSMAEGSVEYVGLVSDSSITTADLMAGRFRDALVIERTVDWRVPWTQPIKTTIRWLGPGTFDEETWRGDALGMSHFLEQGVGELQSVTCPARFGSERCGADASSETYDNIRVATTLSTNAAAFTANSSDLPSTADDWFENGELLWLTGDNVNTRSIVKRYDDATRLFVLTQEPGYPINTTDTFQVVVGCLKRYVEDCITKHDNGPNFRGDPFILGTDDQFDTLKA